MPTQPERNPGHAQMFEDRRITASDPTGSIARSNFVPTLPTRSTLDPYGSNAEVHILDYVRVLYKRRWTAATALVVVVLSAAVYVLTATPIYEAKARLLIESEKQNVVAFKEVIEQDQTTDGYYQTQYKLLEGRALAAKTLDTLKLWNHREFDEAVKEQSGFRRLIGAALQTLTNGSRQRPDQLDSHLDLRPSGETTQQSRAIDAFLDQLFVSPVRNSRLVDVRFRSADPWLAASVANAQAGGYIEQSLEFKFQASKGASDWLGARLAEQRKKVEESEAAIQAYRERNDAGALGDRQNIVVQKLGDLNAVVTKAKTDLIEKEAQYRQIEASERDPATLDAFPAILSNSFIQQLKTQVAELQRQHAQLSDHLGERHPDMIKVTTALQAAEGKLRAEIAKIVQSVRNDYLSAAAQERSLVAALESQKREALAMNRKGIEGDVLKRDADSNRQLYESLLQRAKETGVSGDLKTSGIRFVDFAEVPRTPISPNKPLFLLLACLVGSVIALGLAFFFEYLDDRIKKPEEIKTHLGLSTLGLVPRAEKNLQGSSGLISNGVPLNVAEAFRTIRTSVLFSSCSADSTTHTVVVTSTAPGEGKTLTSSNLAVALAQAGERVLLIDTDMRRPRVHEMFEIEQEPGLSNFLVGNAGAKEASHASGVTGLWVMPAGRIPPNPAELLASQRFRDFLSTLSEHFGWVVLDSPPVLAVTDAAVVAHLAQGIIFVIGAEMTSRRAAVTAIERLERANGRFIGAVLNRVDLQRNAYYYSQYYRREYADYYVRAANS